MVKLPIVARHLGPLLERHQQSIDILRQRTDVRGGLIDSDISDLDIEGYNKFIPYTLYPRALHRQRAQIAETLQSIAGSMESRRRRRQSGQHSGTIWRRRPPPSRGHFAGTQRTSARSRGIQGNRRKIATVKFSRQYFRWGLTRPK